MSLLKSGELLAKKYDYKIPEICTDLLRPIIEELDTEDLEWFEPKMRKLLDEGVIDFYYIVYNPELAEMCTEGALGEEIERRLQAEWLKKVRTHIDQCENRRCSRAGFPICNKAFCMA